MIDFYTYIHCKPDGTPFYVGKGNGKRSHEFGRGRRSMHHQNIVAKYGKENIGVFVFPCDSEEQAFSDERQQIAQLRNEGYQLCNVTDGGQGSSGTKRVFSAEHRARLSASHTGRKASEETKAKMSASRKGRKLSPEHAEALRLSNIGSKRSIGNKHNIGRKHTPDVIAKRAEGIKKAWANRTDRTHSDETLQKISEKQKQRWEDGKYQSRSAMNRTKLKE